MKTPVGILRHAMKSDSELNHSNSVGFDLAQKLSHLNQIHGGISKRHMRHSSTGLTPIGQKVKQKLITRTKTLLQGELIDELKPSLFLR